MMPAPMSARFCRCVAWLATFAAAGAAEPARVPSASEVVELSPFEVNTSRDVGYAAENTLAGSRLNARLRDTAGSVAVLTKEFLDDLAITDLQGILEYSVNAELDTNAWQATSEQNPMITGENLLTRTSIRGLAASQGMDYFMSITNMDPYRVGRFEDTRGPNSILFGIGAPGGLLNQTSKSAALHRHSATLRYGFGSWDRSRAEFDVNRVLVRDRLAATVAAVQQENGGWRQFDFQDKKRLFSSVVFRPVRALTLQAMGEVGRDQGAVMKSTPPTDAVLAWLDNRNARGVSAVTVAPTTAAPSAALVALGITARNGTSGGLNRRATWIENDGTIFDAIGTYLTGSYNTAGVRAPDGTPGATGGGLMINDPSVYPRWANAGGPGMRREQKLYNYTFSADWQPLRSLAVNVGQNYQQTTLTSRILVAANPTLRGEPNRTLGLNGPANPYAGQLYFEGNWRGDIHYGEFRETRVAATYSLASRQRPWLGRHRLAGAWSTSQQVDLHALSWLSLVGSPFNATPNNANNQVALRNYATEGDYGTYRVGDWRRVPQKFTFGGRTFDLAFVNDSAGANNSGMKQTNDSGLGVLQSYLFKDRLVTTFGVRRDQVEITQFGYYRDAVIGDAIDKDPAKASVNRLTARTQSTGAVFHVTEWLSLIANRSSNTGVPPLARTVFPLGQLAPLSRGKGEDVGIGLDLLDGRVSARLSYFTGEEKGRITSSGLGGAPARNQRVTDAFASVLVGAGRPFTAEQWTSVTRELNPPVNAIASDFLTEGYEARITTNLTRNWRLVLNYSYTDSGRTNVANELADWYGLKKAEGVLMVQGARQLADGRYVVDPGAYQSGGTVARWIELGNRSPAANLSNLATGTGGVTVAQEIFDLVDTLNDTKEQEEKRWGVRPHKVSFFTAYDFKEGWAKGITVGGGWRWRSANVIGSDSRGREITGKEIGAADAMLAYSWKVPRLPGRVRLQVNVANLLNDTKIIPVRLSTSDTVPDGFQLPGGRGQAYSRYDLVAPREYRLTTTYSF
ncbi:MAG: TonB-dependent receptor plug domain-containing protein [Verrucomicrobia bacterium]|nr:TonB-dependent receptor plug domain-containing protein [Verrucomicrobiota bacterium]